MREGIWMEKLNLQLLRWNSLAAPMAAPADHSLMYYSAEQTCGAICGLQMSLCLVQTEFPFCPSFAPDVVFRERTSSDFY